MNRTAHNLKDFLQDWASPIGCSTFVLIMNHDLAKSKQNFLIFCIFFVYILGRMSSFINFVSKSKIRRKQLPAGTQLSTTTNVLNPEKRLPRFACAEFFSGLEPRFRCFLSFQSKLDIRPSKFQKEL